MKRGVGILALVGSLVATTRVAEAASLPNIQGAAFGFELAPQSVAGAAIFAGVFNGQVGKNTSAFGYFAIAVTHDPLPGPGEAASLTGGAWELGAARKRFRGVVTGGTLYNNGDNTFRVTAILELTEGGSGTLTFSGVLNHNTLIPTISGNLVP